MLLQTFTQLREDAWEGLGHLATSQWCSSEERHVWCLRFQGRWGGDPVG